MNNFKFQISNFKNNKGFTFIELLTVAAVIVVVGVMIVAVIASSLRGSNRSNNVSDIRERGTFILSQMSKTLSYAKSFDGVKVNAGDSYTADCTVSVVPPPPPAQYKYIRFTSFDLGQTTYSCTTDNIASNGANLINTANMSVSECYFTCTQSGVSDSPQIDIHFTLSKNPTSTFIENRISTPFQTSVSFRNN
ncbi:MAG: hypothetical protein A2171_01880 [Candidatus Levybacteria bacterium RBG_13_35_9]|nr:MAG: hypothetical protein A2171_01880 [Candidatus Levybacteria bacterium RBG_13_35_9]